MRRGVKVNEKMEIKRQSQESCAKNKDTKTPYILSYVLFANVKLQHYGRMKLFHQNYSCENYTSNICEKNKKGFAAYF